MYPSYFLSIQQAPANFIRSKLNANSGCNLNQNMKHINIQRQKGNNEMDANRSDEKWARKRQKWIQIVSHAGHDISRALVPKEKGSTLSK